jgi:lysophospholipase L1-like esterase
MIKNKILHLLLIVILYSASVQAQGNLPYWNEVQAFKKKDSIQFPSANQILFIGSSSFTNWKDVQQYFPSYPILNRAFGGSSLTDLIRYRYDVLFAYQPKQIVMYCGENDFAASDTVTVETVLQRFKTFFQLMRAKYKTVPFAYVSMKPSPSRAHLMPKYSEANKQIKKYLSNKPKTVFIDVYHSMLLADGTAMKNIFLSDSLHMNSKGYAIWKRKIAPYLIK